MTTRGNRSGLTGLEVIAALAAIGVVTWLVKPSLFPGASRRAAKSTEATAAVEKATAAVDRSVTAQGAAAAAIGVEIGVANGMAPDSPSKSFIGRELPLLASLLPPPDQTALLAAERRRVAVMEGNLDEARRLYESQSKEAARMQKERDAALTARATADAARRAADLALEQAAAAEHARTMQMLAIGGVALLFLAGWIYTKANSVSIPMAGKMAADIRAGVDGVAAMSYYVRPGLFPKIQKAAKLATELPEPPPKPKPTP